MLRKLLSLVICILATIFSVSAQTPPDNEIWYTTTDGKMVNVNATSSAYTINQKYSNGKWILKLYDDYIGNYTIIDVIGGCWEWDTLLFSGCTSLKSINIPESVTKIGEDAFKECQSTLAIKCLATIPPQISTLGISEETTIYVPKKVVSAYKKAENWANYKKQIKRIKE